MGEFIRERLPDAQTFFESRGLALKGNGKWRTTRCEFHGGSDSMRVKVESGAWVCMACLTKGNDVLSYLMQADNLGFVTAAKRLGAWAGDDRPSTDRPRTLSPRDAMEVIVLELLTVMLVISDIRQGLIPPDNVWTRFLEHVGNIEALVMEYRT